MTQRWTDEMLDKLGDDVRELTESIKTQQEEQRELTIRFNAYQMASQWVVNLAFGLLATATITTIITAVVK